MITPRRVTIAEHAERVLSALDPAGQERVPVARALGRVLAEDVRAVESVPAYAAAAMDGYAVRAADTGAAALPVVMEVIAAPQAPRTLAPSTAALVMTGAPIPLGADCVVPVELAAPAEDRVMLPSYPRGRHVRSAGEDLAANAVTLSAGAMLTGSRLALLTAVGVLEVAVRRRPRVLLVPTGTELVNHGRPVAHGEVRDVNGPMLESLLERTGCEVSLVPAVTDEPAGLLRIVDAAMPHVDLVVTAGGISAGTREVVKQSFEGRGVDFYSIPFKPGHPQGIGRYGTLPLVALPGSPAAALASFVMFVRPAISWALGASAPREDSVLLEAAETMSSNPGALQLLPVGIDAGGQARALAFGRPSLATWLTARGLAVLPEGTSGVAAGEPVRVLLLD